MTKQEEKTQEKLWNSVKSTGNSSVLTHPFLLIPSYLKHPSIWPPERHSPGVSSFCAFSISSPENQTFSSPVYQSCLPCLFCINRCVYCLGHWKPAGPAQFLLRSPIHCSLSGCLLSLTQATHSHEDYSLHPLPSWHQFSVSQMSPVCTYLQGYKTWEPLGRSYRSPRACIVYLLKSHLSNAFIADQ